MKALLDTNIIIHRENYRVIHDDIGLLFGWLDKLKYDKCVHPVTVKEISKFADEKVVFSFHRKLESYCLLKTTSAICSEVKEVSDKIDRTENDKNDTILLNEVFCGRVDLLVTEDKLIHTKAMELGIANKIFFIDSFIEKCLVENPSFIDYKIQSVKKEYFGNININDTFFDSFKRDYNGFEKWFIRKADETAYVCQDNGEIRAFLYLKAENEKENYTDIEPIFKPKKRLKIGTLKVTLNGYRIGERFIKIIIDNALKLKVDEIYVTIFENTIEQKRLVRLIEEYGFYKHGTKTSSSGVENVYVKDMSPTIDKNDYKKSYPFMDANRSVFIVPIYPQYHTSLLPDSILTNENPDTFEEQESYRNAISKVYICRSFERNIKPGDIIVFYRTGGYYKSVVTTLGIVENVCTSITTSDEFINQCRSRSVFTNEELLEQWNYNRYNRPFVVKFLYAYSFPKLLNLKSLIELGIINDVGSAPRGFTKITREQFMKVIEETHTNENIIIS